MIECQKRREREIEQNGGIGSTLSTLVNIPIDRYLDSSGVHTQHRVICLSKSGSSSLAAIAGKQSQKCVDAFVWGVVGEMISIIP